MFDRTWLVSLPGLAVSLVGSNGRCDRRCGVRRQGIRGRAARDPFLKLGVAAMALALAFAGVVAFFSSLEGPQQAAASRKSPEEVTGGGLVRSDPGVEPLVERKVDPTQTAEQSASAQVSASPQPRDRDSSSLPLDEDGYPLPTDEQVENTDHSRRFHLPRGAIMTLSVPSIELRNVPVLESDTRNALDRGVVHLPDTSMPFLDPPERNVYLAGHRLGWPRTGSHLVFYRLDELDGGERITLRGSEGRKYDYRVTESFKVAPDERWVTGRVRGQDLLTLQTCTPIPTFQWRLIVRAERV